MILSEISYLMRICYLIFVSEVSDTFKVHSDWSYSAVFLHHSSSTKLLSKQLSIALTSYNKCAILRSIKFICKYIRKNIWSRYDKFVPREPICNHWSNHIENKIYLSSFTMPYSKYSINNMWWIVNTYVKCSFYVQIGKTISQY